MDTSDEKPLRFTLRELLIAIGLIACTLVAGRISESPSISVHLTLVLVGWAMMRYAHGHLAGIISTMLGIDILICLGLGWAYYGTGDFFGFRQIFAIFASFLVAIGIGIFLIIASLKRRYWRWQVGNAIFAICVLAAWWVAIPAIGSAVIAQRHARDTASNNAAMAKAVAQIESIRKQLGRVPDEPQLTDLLDEPLPNIHWGEWKTQIKYRKRSDSSSKFSKLR
jgi:hypothetical protein